MPSVSFSNFMLFLSASHVFIQFRKSGNGVLNQPVKYGVVVVRLSGHRLIQRGLRLFDGQVGERVRERRGFEGVHLVSVG